MKILVIIFILSFPLRAFPLLPLLDGAAIAWQMSQDTIARMNAHAEVLNKWKKNVEMIQEQTDQLQKMREIMGDPKAALRKAGMDMWNGDNPANFYNERYLFHKFKADASGLKSMAYEAGGLFKKIKSEDEDGVPINRDEDGYKRYDVVERQYENILDTEKALSTKQAELSSKFWKTIKQFEAAETSEEIGLLQCKLQTIKSEIDMAQASKQDEMNKIIAQDILNRTEQEKEKKAHYEEFVHAQSKSNQAYADFLNGIPFRQNKNEKKK